MDGNRTYTGGTDRGNFDLERNFVAENYSYYEDCFDRFYNEGGKISFNWAAFLVPVSWCVYRKMYSVAAVAGVVRMLIFLTDAPMVLCFVPMLALGLYGSYIYKGYVLEETYKVKDADEVEKKKACKIKGGTDMLLAAIVFIFFVMMYCYDGGRFMVNMWDNSRVSSGIQ